MARQMALGLFTLVLAATTAAQKPSLVTLRLPGGTRLVGTGAGEILAWQPGSTVTHWDGSGCRLGKFAADGLTPQDGAPFAARRDRALLCAPAGVASAAALGKLSAVANWGVFPGIGTLRASGLRTRGGCWPSLSPPGCLKCVVGPMTAAS